MLAFAAGLLIFSVPLYRTLNATATLSTARDAASLPQVHADRGVVLKIDTTQIPEPGGYQLEVVNADGLPIWHVEAEANHNQIVAPVPMPLAPGRYWVRLYDTASPRTLLREYGLDVGN